MNPPDPIEDRPASVLSTFVHPYALCLLAFLACMVSVSFDIPAIHQAAIIARWPLLGTMAAIGLIPLLVRGLVWSASVLWMALFLAIAGLSTLWTMDFEYTAQRVVSLVLLYLATLGGIASFSRSPNGARQVFDVVFVIAALTAVGGFLFRMGDLGEGRYVGLHNRATGAGSYAALFLPVVIYQARYRFRGLGAIFAWLVVFALLGQIVLAGARAALAVSLLVCFALWLDFYGRKALIPLVLLLVVAPVPILLDARQAEKIEERSRQWIRADSISTFTGRLDRWKFGIEKWLERPLIGYGFGSSRTLASVDQPWRFRLQPGEIFNLHSDQIEALLDLGIVGGIPFISFWISVGVLGLRLFLRPRDPFRSIGIAALGGSFYAFADTFMHGGFLSAGGGVSSFSWLLIAVLSAMAVEPQRQPAPRSEPVELDLARPSRLGSAKRHVLARRASPDSLPSVRQVLAERSPSETRQSTRV